MNRYYIIAIIVLAVVILGGVLWFFTLRPDPVTPAVEPNKNLDDILSTISGNAPDQFVRNPAAITEGGSAPVPTRIELVPLTPEEEAEQTIEKTVARFVERWGTYSNQTNFSNIRSLDSLMTQSMENSIETYISSIQREHPYQEGYYGVTTKVVSVKVEEFSLESTDLTVIVGTRRDETRLDGTTDTFNQHAEVQITQGSGTWLVSSLVWLDE